MSQNNHLEILGSEVEKNEHSEQVAILRRELENQFTPDGKKLLKLYQEKLQDLKGNGKKVDFKVKNSLISLSFDQQSQFHCIIDGVEKDFTIWLIANS